MKNKNQAMPTVMLFFSLILTLLTLSCGSGPQIITYYNPAWTPEGKIMAIKEVAETFHSGGLIGGGTGYDKIAFIVTVDPYSDEEITIKSFPSNSYPLLNVAPTGNFVAAKPSLRKIDIYDSLFSLYASIETERDIEKFDWSHDGEYLFVKFETGSNIYTKEGTLHVNRELLKVFYDAWKYSENIVGYGLNRGDPFFLYFDVNGSALPTPSIAKDFELIQYFPDGKTIFARDEKSYYTLDYDFNFTKLSLKRGKFTIYNESIHPTNNTVFMFSDKVNIFDETSVSGINLSDLDGKKIRTIR